MKKLFFTSFIVGILICSYSCNVKDTGNSSIFPAAPAVVSYDLNMGGIIMNTVWGNIAAPSLLSSYPGDCLYVHEFTVDYDNQPSTNYFTATNIVKDDVSKYGFEESSSIDLGEFTLPLSKLEGATSEFFHGIFFFSATSKDKSPDFRIIYNTEEQETDGIKNLYILAKSSTSGVGTSDVANLGAFNIANFIYYQGRDTTLYYSGGSNGYTYKYARVNLKYLSKITGDKPEFETVSTLYYTLLQVN